MLCLCRFLLLQPINLVNRWYDGCFDVVAPIISVISIGTIYLILNVSALIIGGLIFGKQFFLELSMQHYLHRYW